MQEGTPIKQYIKEFNKAVLDYQNVAKYMDNDHIAILFLCSLPYSYDSIKDQILHGTNSISMDDITSILLSKDLLRKSRMESGRVRVLLSTVGGLESVVTVMVMLLAMIGENLRVIQSPVQATKLSADIARIMAI
jgi:hypothetical protein